MTEKPSFVNELALTQTQSFEVSQPIVINYGPIHRPEHREYSDLEAEVAGHELNHAAAGIVYGNIPLSLSVERDGSSLGRNVFAGPVALPVIAAGAVETPFGEAEGYGSLNHHGSDLGHFRRLFPDKNDEELKEIIGDSVRKARSAIYELIPDREVRKRVAIIIASMKNVTGSLIPDIIRIAELEVRNGVTTAAPKVKELFDNAINSQAYKDAVRAGKVTVIEIDENGVSIVKTLVMDKDAKERTLCPTCHITGGHEESCPKLNIQERLPRSANIFEISRSNALEEKIAA